MATLIFLYCALAASVFLSVAFVNITICEMVYDKESTPQIRIITAFAFTLVVLLYTIINNYSF